MSLATSGSLIHDYAGMKPTEFGTAMKPKMWLCERLLAEVQSAVEEEQVSPLDGARVISSITATLFGYGGVDLGDIPADSWFGAEKSDH